MARPTPPASTSPRGLSSSSGRSAFQNSLPPDGRRLSNTHAFIFFEASEISHQVRLGGLRRQELRPSGARSSRVPESPSAQPGVFSISSRDFRTPKTPLPRYSILWLPAATAGDAEDDVSEISKKTTFPGAKTTFATHYKSICSVFRHNDLAFA
ncbi:hypothetical protein K4K49_004986 [Colletotrichum sp. SAR 10_70]|nr:hypothetical protein K4K50_008051 [Colletotrichum sp. SAR 10_71]KAI8189451.1 hypothetical protein K4K51_004619 [Colletotrichum sp. SAR 10_75]KAI8197785.1 hypothetical protein K4K49_004986 [Colletotrichum sp. SAR 10_70]KAI8205365.1 hypothetical protein KHU50_001851 [Colletotrichum sp. SAR 10_65]KAI8215482.1 hypothetical protein K4K52_006242 [Colletotrichum sp. SAR 10_76]KAI8227959.1 hypothetical protein K4K54_002615 [Colletotrichum sp. SAR 10_86]KAJ5006770.1 hypothetical protein K4K48_00249